MFLPTRLALATVLFLVFTPLAAQNFNKGVAAYLDGDFTTALQEWMPLAEQGSAKAQNWLGIVYRYGSGVPQNYTEAVKWYRLAAEQGDARAQANLGAQYTNGRGVPKNYAEAVKWYRLAAEQGLAIGQNNLGIMYERGEGVPQDYVMAHMWYNISSANGHDKASEWRDERAGLMTTAAIETAQAMARECMSSEYTKCGY